MTVFFIQKEMLPLMRTAKMQLRYDHKCFSSFSSVYANLNNLIKEFRINAKKNPHYFLPEDDVNER